MRTILITTPSLSFNDAVSNDTWQLERFLASKGFQVFIYAEHAPDRLDVNVLTYDQASLLTRTKDLLWIYQHSVYWHRGEMLLNQAMCRVIMRYHNITPPDFFERYGEKIATYATKQGIAQTLRYVKSDRFEKYINASRFNSEELVAMGAESTKMHDVAPLHKIDEFKIAHMSDKITEGVNKDETNILFVGRFAPNKGFVHLLRTLDRYIELFGTKVKLHLGGNFGMVAPLYLKELQAIIKERRLGSHVKIWGSINLHELYTLYKTCDVMLVMSEHEGFCVPLIEAQFNYLPVVALDRTAVKETLGPDQLCFKELDYDRFAAAAHLVANDEHVRNFLVEKGYRNQEQYENGRLEAKFYDHLNW